MVDDRQAAPPASAPGACSAALDRVLDALERHGCRVTGAGRQRKAQCPAHDDRDPSLSVLDGEYRVKLRCWAGCDEDQVLDAVGLARADLSTGRRSRDRGADTWAPWQRGNNACPCHPIARYSYTDEHGELLFQVVRGEHKEFSQRRPDPSSPSGWRWSGVSEVRHVLYRLPAILAAPPTACIFVTEGESDVHALEAAGEVATCNPGGTGGGWRPEYAGPLADRDVLVVADRDEPGREHAWSVYQSVRPVARSAWIVQAREGKDARDHLAAGLGVADFTWWEL